MACAWSLSRFPDRFHVEVWEALPETGGVASTCAIDGGEVSLCMVVVGHVRQLLASGRADGPSWLPAPMRMSPFLPLPNAGEEINDQVQGGAPSYRNNLLFFKASALCRAWSDGKAYSVAGCLAFVVRAACPPPAPPPGHVLRCTRV